MLDNSKMVSQRERELISLQMVATSKLNGKMVLLLEKVNLSVKTTSMLETFHKLKCMERENLLIQMVINILGNSSTITDMVRANFFIKLMFWKENGRKTKN